MLYNSAVLVYLLFQVINLDSGVDYRTHGQSTDTVYFVKSECDADQEVNTIFKVRFYP